MLITEDRVLNAKTTQREAHVIPIDEWKSFSDWYSLFDRDSKANPLQHPDYVIAELVGRDRTDSMQPALVRFGTETEADGIGILIPKSVRTRQVGGVGPGWTIRGFRLAGGTFLTANDSFEIQSTLLSATVRHCVRVGADFLLIEDLDEQSTLFAAAQNESAQGFHLFAARERQPRWRIEFPEKEEDYWKTFSSRTRRAFRTRLKKFGQTRLERITDIIQIPHFLAAANEISKQSWQSRQFGLRIRNDESELRCLSVLARQGFLRSYLWHVEDKPVAFAICHQHQGCFRYEEIAYCAPFSPLSPGETMLQQIVEDLYRYDPPRVFDFGGGDGEYKRRFGNLESRSQSVWLVPSTWRAGSTLAYLNGCRRLRSCARGLIRTCGLATKARQWLRYGGRSAHAKIDVAAKGPDSSDNDHPETSGKAHP